MKVSSIKWNSMVPYSEGSPSKKAFPLFLIFTSEDFIDNRLQI